MTGEDPYERSLDELDENLEVRMRLCAAQETVKRLEVEHLALLMRLSTYFQGQGMTNASADTLVATLDGRHQFETERPVIVNGGRPGSGKRK